jgi:hypothetical protein
LQAAMQQCDTERSAITINHLPFRLQHLIFASAAAPLTTCKASAAIISDAGLTAQWLLVKHEQPRGPVDCTRAPAVGCL